MGFKDLIGEEVSFYGVDNHEFKLNDTVYEAIEDESDGWRSYLGSIETVESDGIFFSIPLAVVRVGEFDDGHTDGFSLVDVEDGHVWLEVGTGNYGDWYPYFTFSYYPKEA